MTGAKSSRRRAWVLLGVALLATACGSSGGGAGSSGAPVIDNLRVTYSPAAPIVGALVQVGLLVDVVDADGDWVGGLCRFVTGNQLEVPVSTSGLPANATSGTAICAFVETFTNDQVRIDLVLVDRTGHESNVVSGEVVLQGRGPRR